VAQFLIYSLKLTPLAFHLIVRSRAITPALIHLNSTPQIHLQILECCSPKPSPLAARFFIDSLTLTALVNHSIPQSRALNPGLIYLSNTPLIRFKALLHVVRQTRALATRLLIYSLKHTPLVFHLDCVSPGP